MDTSVLIILFFLNKIWQIEACHQSQQAVSENNSPSSSVCPSCGSQHTVKNGSTYHGKPKRLCRDCGRQFVIAPTKQTVSLETRQLIDRLLLERISLRGIARVTGVS